MSDHLCCEPVCPYCGRLGRIEPTDAILEETRLEEAAVMLERVGWRSDLTLEEAASELADAFELLLADQAPRVALAASRVAERARWKAHKGRGASGLIPGLEAPVAVLPGGSGPDPIYDPGEHGC